MNAEYAQALMSFAALVDEKTGIIRRVDLLKISVEDPQVFLAYAEPCDTTPLTGIAAANRGAACSTTPERAVVRACGESVERYCSTFFDIRTLRLAPAAELEATGDRFVLPGELYPFAPGQYEAADFPYRRAGRSTPLRWVPGTSAITRETVWLPASCVFVPYLFDVAVEPFTHMPISTGLAAGPSVESCVRKGICEILERDALMIVWLARFPAPRIDRESCAGFSPQVDLLLSSMCSGGASWYLNWLTLDVDVPIISAALIDSGTPPLTSFGIAADPDPVRALLLALEEAVLTRLLLNRSEEIIYNPGYVHLKYNTLRGHLLAHATSDALRKRLDFLTEAGPVVPFDAVLARDGGPRGALADRLWRASYEPIWCDVTTRDVRGFGLSVVRTIIPGMQPLDNDHRFRHLGGGRLLSVPRRLGTPVGSLGELNEDPHPFP